MSDCTTERHLCTRREALRQLAAGTLALAVLPACGSDNSVAASDAGPSCTSVHGSDKDGWLSISLAEYPELATPGGSALVKDPDRLLDLVVVHVTDGCFAAVWHICTHGACVVGYQPGSKLVECPCHGSQFGLDGAILRGPATRPLQAFEAIRDGDQLWIHRWS